MNYIEAQGTADAMKRTVRALAIAQDFASDELVGELRDRAERLRGELDDWVASQPDPQAAMAYAKREFWKLDVTGQVLGKAAQRKEITSQE